MFVVVASGNADRIFSFETVGGPNGIRAMRCVTLGSFFVKENIDSSNKRNENMDDRILDLIINIGSSIEEH